MTARAQPHQFDLVDDLALEVEALELSALAAMQHEDLAAGLVPADVTRPLFPHEVAARTNFAGIAQATAQTADQLTVRLEAARRRLAEHITADLAAQRDVPAAMARLAQLRAEGLTSIPAAADTLTALHGDVEDLLAEHALSAAEAAHAEAVAQGVTAAGPTVVPADVLDRVTAAADRVVTGPPADLLRTLADEAFVRAPAAVSARQLADELRSVANSLSVDPLAAVSAQAAAAVDGTGRQGEAARLGAPTVYASELLDRNTCGPCSLIDGHQFDDLADAQTAYPGGTYRLCEGGARCRGTLVFVWDTEAAPSAGPGPNPPGPPTPPPEPAPAPAAPPSAPLPEQLRPPTDNTAVADAAADIPRVRAQIRAHALAVQSDAQAFLDRADALHMARPPRAVGGAPGRAGRRSGAANYDWFDALHPDEQKRLRRAFMHNIDAQAPDEIVTDLSRVYGYQSEDQALEAWLDATRRYDAASAVARGKLPSAASYGGVDVNNLVDSPYDLRALFGNDLERAARHIAEVDQAETEQLAARVFRPVRPGSTPPYLMTEDDYVAELADVEARVALIEPVSDDAEFGPVYRTEDQAILARLDELVPDGLDDVDNPLPANQLWQVIHETARRGGLLLDL